MANQRYVSYLRVSTARQGQSGLGLEAQRATVANFVSGDEWEQVAEFVEIETGTSKRRRPKLEEATQLCKLHRASLIVAKVDRLTRSVRFLHQVLDSGVDVRFCDLPQLEGPTGKFLLTQMASVAELEGGLISQRTKAALAAAKARGVQLGRAGAQNLTNEGRVLGARKSALIRREKSMGYAESIKGVIDEIQSAGITSLRGIAKELTERRIPTSMGRDNWSAVQVSRLLS